MLSPAKEFSLLTTIECMVLCYRATNHVRQQMDYALSCIIIILRTLSIQIFFFPNLILNHQTYRYFTIPFTYYYKLLSDI